MRDTIITDLAKQYVKEISNIKTIIEDTTEITPYTTKVVKRRQVVDKSKIDIEEQIVLNYYKLLINRYCNLKFPNRSFIMAEIMNILPDIHRYHAYTIYKFDFKSFFYTVNSKKIFSYIWESMSLNTFEYNFLNNYTDKCREITPGIGLHNSLIEISGKKFDIEVKKAFKESCLYFARYVDDCILILDENIARDKIEKVIFKLMNQCFGRKVEINIEKTDYFNSSHIDYSFNYLGYEFKKGQNLSQGFKFGIAENKIDKYIALIDKIILEYKNTNDIDVLSFKLELLFKRVVYYGNRKNSDRYRWQVRGISDSYKELKRFMNDNQDFSKITRKTENFFTRAIKQRFDINRVILPPKIKNQIDNRKFISCFINNKALLLHRKIGLNHNDLKQRVSILDNSNLENYDYNKLAQRLLSCIK